MTAAELDHAWSGLPSAVLGQLSGIRAPGLPPESPVYIATDGVRRRQLLVAVPATSEPIRAAATRGLEVLTDDLRIGDSPARTYIQLICLHSAHHSTFTALSANIIAAVKADPTNPKAAVLRCLEKWRSFWAIDRPELTREQALGLFGELWFLYRWMGKVSVTSLARWQGPQGSRHDFQWPTASVEAKTAASGAGAAPIHFIANLDQLADPEVGQLYLFSLHVSDDALAANSLPVLIERITTALSDDTDAIALFSERVAKAGYNPAQAARYARPLRVLSEDLYRVGDTFPRLTRASFRAGPPSGIGNICYTLSMNACVPWRIASSPSDPNAAFLQQ